MTVSETMHCSLFGLNDLSDSSKSMTRGLQSPPNQVVFRGCQEPKNYFGRNHFYLRDFALRVFDARDQTSAIISIPHDIVKKREL